MSESLGEMSPEAELPDEQVTELVREGYDAIADRFAEYLSSIASPASRGWVERLLVGLGPDSRVLDLGCGAGVPAGQMIADAGHQLTGVDISGRQVELARQRLPSAHIIQSDMLKVDFEDGMFDAVVSLYAITHVPRQRWRELFLRIGHWLKPGGLLLASVAAGASPGWLEENFLGFGGQSWTNSLDRETTTRLLEEAGLVPEVVEEISQLEAWGPEHWLYVLARRSC